MRRPLLITAFGPFGGRTVNASALALGDLRRRNPAIRIRILPVDLVEAPRRLHAAIRLVSPRAILLLGEAAGAKCLRIESISWNQMDFDVPDVAGRQPRKLPIDPAAPQHLETPIDGVGLQRRLHEAGHPTELSTDPGRYLCNRIYFAALHRGDVPALFVHLPLERDLPTPQAAAALELIAAAL